MPNSRLQDIMEHTFKYETSPLCFKSTSLNQAILALWAWGGFHRQPPHTSKTLIGPHKLQWLPNKGPVVHSSCSFGVWVFRAIGPWLHTPSPEAAAATWQMICSAWRLSRICWVPISTITGPCGYIIYIYIYTHMSINTRLHTIYIYICICVYAYL